MLLSWNLGTLTSWNPLGHSRTVTGLLYVFTGQRWILWASDYAAGCVAWEAFVFRQRSENVSLYRNVRTGSIGPPAVPLQFITVLKRPVGEGDHLSPPCIPSLRMSRDRHALSHTPSVLYRDKFAFTTWIATCDKTTFRNPQKKLKRTKTTNGVKIYVLLQ
jgi:hypothetical protein